MLKLLCKQMDQYLEEALIVILLSLMSILIGVQVFMRYVMGDSLTWSEELARYCFIWCTYLGVSYAVKTKVHICVEAAVNQLPATLHKWSRIIVHIVFIIFALLVVKEGYALSMKIFKFGQTSSSLGIPMGWIYLAPTVGFGLVIIRLVQEIYKELLNKDATT